MPTVASDEEMAYEVWLAQYQPIDNHLYPDAPFDGKMFETFGSEVSFVQSQLKENIWTLCEHDGATVLSPGYWRVNRMGYFLCRVPWEGQPDDIVVEVDPEASLMVGPGDDEPEQTSLFEEGK
jgi:hypothetical protein